jgi:hypothetical protein
LVARKSLLEFEMMKYRISSISEHTLIGRILCGVNERRIYPSIDLVFQSSFCNCPTNFLQIRK